MDIKPGSCPNSINVDNKGVVTIALQDEGCPPDSVNVYLEQCGKCLEGPVSLSPERYNYVCGFDLYPCPGTTCLTRDCYVVKFKTQDLSRELCLADHVGEEDLYLRIKFGGCFNSTDSVRLLESKKDK